MFKFKRYHEPEGMPPIIPPEKIYSIYSEHFLKPPQDLVNNHDIIYSDEASEYKRNKVGSFLAVIMVISGLVIFSINFIFKFVGDTSFFGEDTQSFLSGESEYIPVEDEITQEGLYDWYQDFYSFYVLGEYTENGYNPVNVKNYMDSSWNEIEKNLPLIGTDFPSSHLFFSQGLESWRNMPEDEDYNAKFSEYVDNYISDDKYLGIMSILPIYEVFRNPESIEDGRVEGDLQITEMENNSLSIIVKVAKSRGINTSGRKISDYVGARYYFIKSGDKWVLDGVSDFENLIYHLAMPAAMENVE